MEKKVSYCGIDCYECPAFLATKADDDAKRAEVAEQWSKEFNADIKPEDINCNGCQSDTGLLFGHCQVCDIRKCAMEKEIKNCAYCSDYSCEKLDSFFKMVPDAGKMLEDIKSAL